LTINLSRKAGSVPVQCTSGKPFDIHDYIGRWLILYFYPKDFTSGCSEEAKLFEARLGRIRDLNGEVVGVSTDTLESHLMFKRVNGLHFDLVADQDGELALLYDALDPTSPSPRCRRVTYLISPLGFAVKEYRHVNICIHAEELVNAISYINGITKT
jgi:peroxiredoxin Q/BCP